MSNGNAMIICLIVGYIKRKSLYKISELDLSNYATKPDLKSVTGIDISKFLEKADFDKSGVDKLDTDKKERF